MLDRLPRPGHIAYMKKLDLPEEEWRKRLSPDRFHVLRQGGTERAFTGLLWDNHDEGGYRCAGCGTLLFGSATKFDSGSGWPSFTSPAAREAVTLHDDVSQRMSSLAMDVGRLRQTLPAEASSSFTATPPIRSQTTRRCTRCGCTSRSRRPIRMARATRSWLPARGSSTR